MRLRRVHCFIKEARRFVAQVHRHNKIPVGALFAMAVHVEDKRVGVVIVGRPVSQELQKREPDTVEVTRLCTDGTMNACSFLYGCAVRAARELGWKSMITYTLATEPGTSLRAAGFRHDAEVKAEESWDRPSRPRVQVDLFGDQQRPTEAKVRWRRAL